MALPTIASLDANNVVQTRNTLPNAGQATSANSLPVVLASDQPPVPVALAPLAAQDGTDAAGVTPPTGAAGIRGWLSAIFARLPVLAAGRVPVDSGTGPSPGLFAVTPSDTAAFATPARSLYVKTAGDVAVVFANGWVETYTVTAPPAYVPDVAAQIVRVNSTNTTATSIRGVL